ncbi:MAG: amidohydrolase family protein, partial [Acidobacteriota bacterium]
MRSINRPISARMPRRRMGVGGWQLFCRRLLDFTVGVTLIAAVTACAQGYPTPTADTILHNGRVYTFTWDDPALDGTPAANAPFSDAGWQPDATAIAIEGGTILFVGSDEDAESYRGQTTRVVDLEGATVLPGLVDAHSHVANLGTVLEQVSLVGINSEEEAVERVAERAASVPAGEWIVGYGWDEGAWADHYPDMKLLSERVPDHPVILRGLHSFAVWGNQKAFEAAG